MRRGARHSVVAPGSRSTPLALALAERDELAVHVVHDERVAAFVALGLGQTGTPALLLCTSGTAAANFAPAIVEAGLSDVPMIVVTADRPPELRDVGAAQTIDQTHLFGRSVRWFHDPGVADAASRSSWRSLARRAWLEAADGPVHLNLPMREPLLGEPTWVAEPLPELEPAARGVITIGGSHGSDLNAVFELADRAGWPVLADPLSGGRPRADVACADLLGRHERFASRFRPDVVVRVGRPFASRVVAEWFAGIPTVQVGGPGVIDPTHDVIVELAVSELAAFPVVSPDPGWRRAWRTAAAAADLAIADALAAGPLSEAAVARTVAEWRPDGVTVVVASSMPVRDLEWYGGPAAVAVANRGANGIDGVVSTALGHALSGRPTVALVGDVALLHDAGALTALRHRGADLRLVVVDNDGGGIFSFLPQADRLPADRFEQLFGTPHGTDLRALAAAHGVAVTEVDDPAALRRELDRTGPRLVVVHSDRAANVAAHHRVHDAALAAVDATLAEEDPGPTA